MNETTIPKLPKSLFENQTAETEFLVFEFWGQFNSVQSLENQYPTFLSGSTHPQTFDMLFQWQPVMQCLVVGEDFSLYELCIEFNSGLWCAERQHKVDELQSTFAVIKSKAEKRQSDLEQTLTVAEKFWDNLNGMTATLKDLQDTLASTDSPALEPDMIRDQQDVIEVTYFVLYKAADVQCLFSVD